MKHYRVMRRGDIYEIEEMLGDGDWMPIAQCDSIEEAKDTLKTIKTLDSEKEDDGK